MLKPSRIRSPSLREGLGEGFMSYEHVKFLRQNQTSAERLLWVQLRAKRLGNVRFRRQHQVGPFIVGFYCMRRSLLLSSTGILTTCKLLMMSAGQNG